MQASPFYTIREACLYYKRGLFALQKGLVCIVKGAYLLRKCGFTRLFLLHTFAQSGILRTLSGVYGCTPKTHKKRTGDFLMDFSRVLSGRKMQISCHTRGRAFETLLPNYGSSIKSTFDTPSVTRYLHVHAAQNSRKIHRKISSAIFVSFGRAAVNA